MEEGKAANYKVQVPRVVQFAFTNLEVIPGVSRTATCKYCGATVTERHNVTSNWVKHLKKNTHPYLYDHYQEWLKNPHQVSVPVSVAESHLVQPHFVTSGNSLSKQDVITDTITRELILAGCHSIKLTEQPYFQRFMKVVHPSYEPVNHIVIIDKIEEIFQQTEMELKEFYSRAPVVNLTVSTWSDRKTLYYLAITGHAIVYGKMKSQLLALVPFDVSSSRKKVSEAIQYTLELYKIVNKIGHVIYDGAKDTGLALSTVLPGCNPALYHIKNDSFWSDVDCEAYSQIKSQISLCSRLPLQQSFIHSLHLVVRDATRDLSMIDQALCKIFETINQVEKDDEKNAKLINGSIAPWQRQLQQIESVMLVGMEKINEALFSSGQILKFTTEDWEQLEELLKVLGPFATAAEDCLSDGKVVTASFVLPAILALNHQLEDFTVKYLQSTLVTLRNSLHRRFEGIIANSLTDTHTIATNLPFGDSLYIAAAVLDPAFKLKFVDYDMTHLSPEQKVLRKLSFQRWTRNYVEEMHPENNCIELELVLGDIETVKTESQEQQGASRRKSLFSYIVPQFSNTSNGLSFSTETLDQELTKYLDATDYCSDTIQFWNQDSLYPRLGKIASYVLSIPASCPSIEKLVAAGDISLKPPPENMPLISKTAVLKCRNADSLDDCFRASL